LFKFDRGHKIQGLVRPLGVIIVHPLLDELVHVGQHEKQLSVK
jgi:hypothetical protein